MADLRPVGRVAKLFGKDGEVVLNLYDAFPEEVNFEEPLFAIIDSLAVPLFFESFSPRGMHGALARFADIDSPARVALIVGHELSIDADRNHYSLDDEDDLSEDGIYLDDMVGFRVRIGDSWGVIEEFIANESNPLFVISLDGREVLVPAVDDFIVSYNVRRRQVRLDLPDGLLDLNS